MTVKFKDLDRHKTPKVKLLWALVPAKQFAWLMHLEFKICYAKLYRPGKLKAGYQGKPIIH